jgi:hypothetical protein
MSDYYSKYLKYKNKYFQLREQLGGNPELIKLYDDSLAKAIDYIDRQRAMGLKIMLIIDAIPSEQNNFNIPPNHVPVYLQQRRYTDSDDIRNFPRAKIESFGEYPVFFGNITKLTDPKFDIIIFNKNKCGKISEFTESTLSNLFALTYDNQSIIILDRENIEKFSGPGSVTVLNNQIATGMFEGITLTTNLPVYTYSINPKNIINKLKAWFNKYLPGKLNYIESALGTNGKFIEPCVFNVQLVEQITNGTTNTVIFYNNNLFYKDNSIVSTNFQRDLLTKGINANNLYMYFVNTKK